MIKDCAPISLMSRKAALVLANPTRPAKGRIARGHHWHQCAHAGPPGRVAICNIAELLEVWKQGVPVEEAPARAAAGLIRMFKGLGMPENLT